MCGSEDQQNLRVYNDDAKRDFGKFQGQLDCNTDSDAAQSSSSMTGSSQDRSRNGDGDGIRDSSDRYTHNSKPKCFKEAAT